MKKNSGSRSNSISAPGNSGSPLRFLMLLAPFFLVLMVGMATVGSSDTLKILLWYTILFLFSLITLPVAFKIFKNFGSGGFMASKVLGILSVSFVVWTLSYIKIFRFNYVFVLIAAAIVAFCCYFPKSLRSNLMDKLSEEYIVERIVIEEAIFAVALVILCYLKGFGSAIRGFQATRSTTTTSASSYGLLLSSCPG